MFIEQQHGGFTPMRLTLADLPTNLPTRGARIRWARRRLKMNQYRLAELVGRNQKTISNWERDIHEPSDDELEQLTHALEIPSPAWLAVGVKEIDRLEPDVIQAALKLQDMPASQRSHYLALILGETSEDDASE